MEQKYYMRSEFSSLHKNLNEGIQWEDIDGDHESIEISQILPSLYIATEYNNKYTYL